MTENSTVCVVGAGPIGLNIAEKIAVQGFEATVLEEDPEIGIPTNCSGLISVSGTNLLGLKIEKCFLSNIYGARIYSPDKTVLEIKRRKPVAKLVDRYLFDKMFEEKALSAGVKIKKNSVFLDYNNDTVFLKQSNRGEMLKTRILIGADGVKSSTRKLIGLNPLNNEFIHSYQETVTGSFEPGIVEVYTGNHYHGLFAWVIPLNKKKAKIGAGVRIGEQNPMKQLDKLKNLNPEWKTIEKESFLIPWGKPFPYYQKNNVLIAGDAAFQTKATTGGGLMLGLECSNYLAETVLNHLKNKKPLEEYNKKCRKIKRELEVHYNISRYLYSLTDSQINKLFQKLKQSGIESFLEEHGDMDKPTKFAAKVLRTPSLWKFFPLALKLFF